MKWCGVGLLGALFLLPSAGGSFSSPPKATADSPDLAPILKGCADYCAKVQSAVLDFVCRETLLEEVYHPHLRKVFMGRTPGGMPTDNMAFTYQVTHNEKTANEFVYDYQLVQKAGHVDERRTLLRENGRDKNEKDAVLKTAGFRYRNIIFGPVVLLGREWQPKHTYEVVGRDTRHGRNAVIIKATPKPGEWLGYLYGKVWVDRDNFSVLRIEWSQDSLENYGRVRPSAGRKNLQPDIILTGEYGREKSGLRFPSRFDVTESYLYAGGAKFSLYKLSVIYDGYKFFTVETEVTY